MIGLSPFPFYGLDHHLAELEKLVVNPLPYSNQSRNMTHADAMIDPVIAYLSTRQDDQITLEEFKRTLFKLYRAPKHKRNDAFIYSTTEWLQQAMPRVRFAMRRLD